MCVCGNLGGIPSVGHSAQNLQKQEAGAEDAGFFMLIFWALKQV